MNNIRKEDPGTNFSLRERLRSFKHAFSGLKLLLRFEHNARIHLFILIIVILAGTLLRISAADWIAIVIVAGMVLASECFNSALEYLSDEVDLHQNENIRRVKDIAAAGVLISAIISAVVGLIIFLPEFYRLFIT